MNNPENSFSVVSKKEAIKDVVWQMLKGKIAEEDTQLAATETRFIDTAATNWSLEQETSLVLNKLCQIPNMCQPIVTK